MQDKFRKTVIVLGAGASREFNLPTGAELTSMIATILDIRFDGFGSGLKSGNSEIVQTLRTLKERRQGMDSINPFLHAGWKIRDNMGIAPSIDNFLHTHSSSDEIIIMGKLAISHAIQMAERRSTLYVDRSASNPKLNFDNVRDTWLGQLFKILVAGRSFDDFLDALSNITFVSFNYDRCVHQFFRYATESYFDLTNDQIRQVLSALSIVYTYGSIGKYLSSNVGNVSTTFGDVRYGDYLISSFENIRTFTEGSGSDEAKFIGEQMKVAKLIVFLGFGFLPLNLELLISGGDYAADRVLGTGKGMSAASVRELEKDLRDSVFGNSIESQLEDAVSIEPFTCAELIFEHSRYLAKV